jgi:hypothetical protein
VPLLAFDCDIYSKPLQVSSSGGAAQYSIRELNLVTGVYAVIATFDQNVNINAVAMYSGAGTLYAAFGAFDGKQLCNFDLDKNRVCFAEELEVQANAGAIIGNDYYYASSPGAPKGSKLYWVENIEETTPTFHESAFSFKTSLFTEAVLDFAPISDVGNAYITGKDNDPTAKYLVGLTKRFQTVIIRVAADGAPNGYAVFESTVKWPAGREETQESIKTGGFGAAFTYNTATGQKALFASNAGSGLFEVLFPIDVVAGCWNSAINTATHKPCTTSKPDVIWRYESLQTKNNDGKPQRRSSRQTRTAAQRPDRESREARSAPG